MFNRFVAKFNGRVDELNSRFDLVTRGLKCLTAWLQRSTGGFEVQPLGCVFQPAG